MRDSFIFSHTVNESAPSRRSSAATIFALQQRLHPCAPSLFVEAAPRQRTLHMFDLQQTPSSFTNAPAPRHREQRRASLHLFDLQQHPSTTVVQPSLEKKKNHAAWQPPRTVTRSVIHEHTTVTAETAREEGGRNPNLGERRRLPRVSVSMDTGMVKVGQIW